MELILLQEQRDSSDEQSNLYCGQWSNSSRYFATVNPTVGATTALSSLYGALFDVGSTANSNVISNQTGMQIQHGSKTGSSGTVTNSYGLQLVPYAQAGTVSNMYSIYINSPTTGGTLTNNWGIYQVDSGAKNYFNGSMGLGIDSPVVKLHQDAGTGTATLHKFTAGTTTGQTSGDGFNIGITATGEATLRQFENLPLSVYTSNTQRMLVAANGQVSLGLTTPATSAALDIQATDGAVLLPRLTTTQRDALTAAAGMILYNTDNAQVECYYSSWKPCTSNSTSSQTSLTTTITISLAKEKQTILVDGNGGPATLSTTPFDSSAPLDGAEIVLIGNSDANAVTIPQNDAAKGVLGYQVVLGRGQTVTYIYNASLDRYVIKSTSN